MKDGEPPNSQEPLKDAFDAHTHDTRELALQVAAAVEQKYKLGFKSPRHIIAAHALAMTFKKELVEEYEAQLLFQSIRNHEDLFRPR